MKAVSKGIAILALALLFFVFFSERGSAYAQRDKQVEAYNFYFDGSQWIPSWFYCDRAKQVMLVLDPPPSPTHRWLVFQKSEPSAINKLELVQQGEAENEMGGKTVWTFTASHTVEQTYSILEVNYNDVSDPSAGYWTRRYQIGLGQDENTAINKRQTCRWFPRTRVALITDKVSIYVTETSSGRLVFTSYEYKQAADRPSLVLTRGTSKRDKAERTDSFIFKKGPYTYRVTVKAPDQPSAQFVVMKNEVAIRKDTVRAYTYTKKP